MAKRTEPLNFTTILLYPILFLRKNLMNLMYSMSPRLMRRHLVKRSRFSPEMADAITVKRVMPPIRGPRSVKVPMPRELKNPEVIEPPEQTMTVYYDELD